MISEIHQNAKNSENKFHKKFKIHNQRQTAPQRRKIEKLGNAKIKHQNMLHKSKHKSIDKPTDKSIHKSKDKEINR